MGRFFSFDPTNSLSPAVKDGPKCVAQVKLVDCVFVVFTESKRYHRFGTILGYRPYPSVLVMITLAVSRNISTFLGGFLLQVFSLRTSCRTITLGR